MDEPSKKIIFRVFSQLHFFTMIITTNKQPKLVYQLPEKAFYCRQRIYEILREKRRHRIETETTQKQNSRGHTKPRITIIS